MFTKTLVSILYVLGTPPVVVSLPWGTPIAGFPGTPPASDTVDTAGNPE